MKMYFGGSIILMSCLRLSSNIHSISFAQRHTYHVAELLSLSLPPFLMHSIPCQQRAPSARKHSAMKRLIMIQSNPSNDYKRDDLLCLLAMNQKTAGTPSGSGTSVSSEQLPGCAGHISCKHTFHVVLGAEDFW